VKASAPFTNDRYDEDAYAEADGVELSRVHISRTFGGDLEGEARACEFEEERSEDPNSTAAAKSATLSDISTRETDLAA